MEGELECVICFSCTQSKDQILILQCCNRSPNSIVLSWVKPRNVEFWKVLNHLNPQLRQLPSARTMVNHSCSMDHLPRRKSSSPAITFSTAKTWTKPSSGRRRFPRDAKAARAASKSVRYTRD